MMNRLYIDFCDLAWDFRGESQMRAGPRFGVTLDERLRALWPVARLFGTDEPLVSVEFVNKKTCAAALRPWNSRQTRVRTVEPGQLDVLPANLGSFRQTLMDVSYTEAGLAERDYGGELSSAAIGRGFEILESSFDRCLRTKWQYLWRGVDSNIVSVVLVPYSLLSATYVLHAARDGHEAMRRLAPLLRQMAQVIVVGSAGAEPDAWFVLCS